MRTASRVAGGALPTLLASVRLMRPHQWAKNLLVFVPLITSRSFSDATEIANTFWLFVSFCATASAIYILNDLSDREADRLHPRKRTRPLASGALSPSFALVQSFLLLALGLGLAYRVEAAVSVAVYATLSLLYSAGLKKFPLLDVFILAALYTLRVIAGGIVSHHPVTLWLLAFSGFTFLSLALVKRCTELANTSTNGGTKLARRGYTPEDRTILQMFGCSSAFASGVVLALFVNSTPATQAYQAPEMLWGVVPLTLFWQCRIWLSAARGWMHDDPIVFAIKDWVSWATLFCMLAIMLLASSGVMALVT